MSLILFFGLTGTIVIVGFIFTALVVRHHWQLYRLERLAKKQKN